MLSLIFEQQEILHKTGWAIFKWEQNLLFCGSAGGCDNAVGRARDSWWGGPGFDSRCGHKLPPGWVFGSNMLPGWDRGHGLPAPSRVWRHVKLSAVSLGTRPRYSLVLEENVMKPTNQPNKESGTANVYHWKFILINSCLNRRTIETVSRFLSHSFSALPNTTYFNFRHWSLYAQVFSSLCWFFGTYLILEFV